MEGIRRELALGLVLIAGTVIEQAPSVVICGVVAPYGIVAVDISDYNLGYASVTQWREYKLLAGRL